MVMELISVFISELISESISELLSELSLAPPRHPASPVRGSDLEPPLPTGLQCGAVSGVNSRNCYGIYFKIHFTINFGINFGIEFEIKFGNATSPGVTRPGFRSRASASDQTTVWGGVRSEF